MQCTTIGNDLLDLLAQSDKEAASFILHDARQIAFDGGRKFQQAGERINSCLFPTDGVLALACDIDDGTEVNTLGVGFDGAIHAGLGTDLAKAYHHVISRLAGRLWEIDAPRWQALLAQNSRVREIAAGFTNSCVCRVHQALACQMHHDLESRFCRCLLELHRWQRGRPLAITHQGLSQFLGVRRATITIMARSLQEAGIISCSRGVIEVSDPYALRQASCPCYELRHSRTDRRGCDHLVETVPTEPVM